VLYEDVDKVGTMNYEDSRIDSGRKFQKVMELVNLVEKLA
jgi:hypothetical protein